jgi:L-ascorbate metabolism protein UlaG (beta-lactamase superfamily)
MRISLLVFMLFSFGLARAGSTARPFEEDTIPTTIGDLKIIFVGHASLIFECSGKVIHVDPVSSEADYATLPKADIILITHEHFDHFDSRAIGLIRGPDTKIVVSRSCAGKIAGAEVLANGEKTTILGYPIEAVPAYNIVHKRPDGNPFHPKGNGNGYIVRFGDQRVYVAGDTEAIPEMKALKDIDIAFLPVNMPYTMDMEMAAQAARTIRPRILYPYHYGTTDIGKLVAALKTEKGIEVRIRKLS